MRTRRRIGDGGRGDERALQDHAERALAMALHYRDHLGWALLPVGPDKQPHFALLPRDEEGRPEWKPLGQRPATASEIKEWFREDAWCNIGVITGEASGGLVVADFDKKPLPVGIPITPCATTFRYMHAYFKSPGPLASFSFQGGDFLAEGKYAVLPPSIHPKRIVYEWIGGLSPRDTDAADLPDWIRALGRAGVTAASPAVPRREYSLLGTPPTASDLSGWDLGAWDRNPVVIAATAARLGIPRGAATPEGIGKSFLCVLPGHEEKHPSASLYRRNDGLVVYRDWHGGDEQWHYLTEIYASQCCQRLVKLGKVELPTWHIRLLVELGLVAPAPVEMPPLPRGAKPHVVKLYEGFRLLLGCKWLHTPATGAPFSWRFAVMLSIAARIYTTHSRPDYTTRLSVGRCRK